MAGGQWEALDNLVADVGCCLVCLPVLEDGVFSETQNDSSPENKRMMEKMKELTKTASEYCDKRKMITNR